MPPKKNHSKTIESLRDRIDSIDDGIITLLAERAAYVKEVGMIKAREAKDRNIIRPGREAMMLRKIVTKAKGIFPEEGIAMIWRLIIAASITLEEKISLSVYSPENDMRSSEYKGMVREYFGPFTPVKSRKRIREILDDIRANKEIIGAIPFFNRRFGEKWFADFFEKGGCKAFAILPFINFDPKKPLLLVGKVTPEKTGSDISLFALAEKKLSKAVLSKLLASAGFSEQNCRTHASEKTVKKPFNLIEIFDFVAADDERITKLKATIGKKGGRLYYVGSYATPLNNLGISR